MLNRLHSIGMTGNPIGALLDMPRLGVAPFVVGTIGALYEPSIVIETELVRADERLVRELLSMMDRQLLSVLEARSAAEFSQLRAEVFPKYVRALRAVADTMSNLIPESEIETLSGEATASIIKDLEKQRGVIIASPLVDQSIFTLWTLSKIRTLGRRIEVAGRVSADKEGDDLKLLKEYRLTSLWAQFHLDSALSSIKFKRPLPDDVQGIIHDGLRSAVNAYAIMREALSLRTLVEEVPPAELPWTDEDETLLASSMRDINAFSDFGDS